MLATIFWIFVLLVCFRLFVKDIAQISYKERKRLRERERDTRLW